jgi:hypothetical protein
MIVTDIPLGISVTIMLAPILNTWKAVSGR